MLKYLTKILLIIGIAALTSCAKRNPEPIADYDIIKVAEDDLEKIEKIKEENNLFNEKLKIDLYTATDNGCSSRAFHIRTFSIVVRLV